MSSKTRSTLRILRLIPLFLLPQKRLLPRRLASIGSTSSWFKCGTAIVSICRKPGREKNRAGRGKGGSGDPGRTNISAKSRAISARAAFATDFQPYKAILSGMGTRPDDSKTAVPALSRRHPLLAAYLDALKRLDRPRCRIALARRTQRRPLLQSVERRRAGRHLHLVSSRHV